MTTDETVAIAGSIRQLVVQDLASGQRPLGCGAAQWDLPAPGIKAANQGCRRVLPLSEVSFEDVEWHHEKGRQQGRRSRESDGSDGRVVRLGEGRNVVQKQRCAVRVPPRTAARGLERA